MPVTTILTNKISNIHTQLLNPHAYYARMPISEKRLAANRANAKLSTGPATAAGKRISSRNGARKSDLSTFILIDGESAARFDALLRAYKTESSPPPPPSRPSSKTWSSPDGIRAVLLPSTPPPSTTKCATSAVSKIATTTIPPAPAPCTPSAQCRQVSASRTAQPRSVSARPPVQPRLTRPRAISAEKQNVAGENQKMQKNTRQSEENKGEAR